MPSHPSLSILAVVYTDGLAADKLLAAWGHALRAAGMSVAGLVQFNSFERDPDKCDMAVDPGVDGLDLVELRAVRFSEDGTRDRSAEL